MLLISLLTQIKHHIYAFEKFFPLLFFSFLFTITNQTVKRQSSLFFYSSHILIYMHFFQFEILNMRSDASEIVKG